MSGTNQEDKFAPTVEITFTDDWSVVRTEQIYPGCSLVIHYAKKRLLPEQSGNTSDVTTEQSGDTSDLTTDQSAAAITGDFYGELTFHKNGRPISKRLSQHPDENPSLLSTVVDVPIYCREITIWFKFAQANGQSKYDSNNGANYVYPVRGNAIMIFPFNADVQDKGYITPGGTLRICYDSRRLPGRDYYLGQPSWDIQAAAMFTAHERGVSKVMHATSNDVDPLMMCDFDVPEDASFVSVWFKHWGHFSGDSFDTNWGRNYVRSFEYDGEISFTEEMKVIQKGFLLNGRRVCVHFDTNRIFRKVPEVVIDKICDKVVRKWLKLHAAFGREVTEKVFGEVYANNRVKAVLDVPMEATRIELWFTYGDIGTKEVSFDSNFGQNYHFEILY